MDSDIYLIPVRLENCETPQSLTKFQRVDLFKKNGWPQLVKAIQSGMERRSGVSKSAVKEKPSSGKKMITLEEDSEQVYMDDKALAKLALQKLLDYQMPTGEWGYYDVDFEKRYKRVKREKYLSDTYLHLFRKPNVYRTLTAMEVLRNYCSYLFNIRIHEAIRWIKQNLSSGWFVEWDEFTTGRSPDRRDQSHVEKAPDIRHTAQALLGLLKFDRSPGLELRKGLYNILNHQFEDGMWPRKPRFNHIEIFRSVCCADLLFHALDHRYRQKLSRLDLGEDFFQKARVALDRTCAWLINCADNHGGLWEDEYQTAMVLERLGQQLLSDKRYGATVKRAVEVLLKRMTNDGWIDSSIPDPKIREDSKYETTVRICASLYIIQGRKLWIPEEKLQPVRDYLRERFRPDEIDASDYRYFLQIFYPDSNGFRESIQRKNFFDYLNPRELDLFSTYPGRYSLLGTMGLWVIDCLERLEKLEKGKDSGLRNYDQAFYEKEKELLAILDKMCLISMQLPIESVPSFFLQYFQTGDLKSIREQVEKFCNKYQLQIKRKLPLSKKVYNEKVRKLFAELIDKYVELMSNPNKNGDEANNLLR